MGAKFGYHELYAKDPKKAEAFYGKVFGWKFQPAPAGMDYTFIDMGDGAMGGMMKCPPDMPPQWLNYFVVDDLAAKAKEAEGAGAKVVVPKTEVPGFGWFTMLTDPAGASFALWQEMKKK